MTSENRVRTTGPESLARVKHIVAIASGKGGVGKSTLSSNLAVALSSLGAKVGLMDADIYGASQPGMFGTSGDANQLKVDNDMLVPMEKHGVKFVSIGLLTGEDNVIIWRAPMVVKLLQQFIHQVEWGELDYLLIDLPPGTGDIQLTLAQNAELSGAVVVTTPQQVAMGIAKKGLHMFRQVNVPILGIIENMSGFTCPSCNHKTDIFHKGGGKELASATRVPLLGAIPLDTAIMESGEAGLPVVRKSAASPAASAFLEVAEALEKEFKRVDAAHDHTLPAEEWIDEKNGLFHVVWNNGDKTVHNPYNLRVNCPCASCVDEDTGKKILDPAHVSLDIRIKDATRIGRYAYAFTFSDDHSTGIYKFDLLRSKLNDAESEDDDSFSV